MCLTHNAHQCVAHNCVAWPRPSWLDGKTYDPASKLVRLKHSIGRAQKQKKFNWILNPPD